MNNQKGFSVIGVILSILILSAIAVGGAWIFKQKIPETSQPVVESEEGLGKPESPEISGWNLYKSTKGRFSLDYPDNQLNLYTAQTAYPPYSGKLSDRVPGFQQLGIKSGEQITFDGVRFLYSIPSKPPLAENAQCSTGETEKTLPCLEISDYIQFIWIDKPYPEVLKSLKEYLGKEIEKETDYPNPYGGNAPVRVAFLRGIERVYSQRSLEFEGQRNYFIPMKNGTLIASWAFDYNNRIQFSERKDLFEKIVGTIRFFE